MPSNLPGMRLLPHRSTQSRRSCPGSQTSWWYIIVSVATEETPREHISAKDMADMEDRSAPVWNHRNGESNDMGKTKPSNALRGYH